MTHRLSSLAGGKVVIVLEGGYNLESISQSALMCSHALLGNTDMLTHVNQSTRVKRSAVESARNVIKQHAKYWKCLEGFP